MSKKMIDGIWVVECDWSDPGTGALCDLGAGGEPCQFIDPDSGRDPNTHYQCGRHHGIIPQSEDPDFQAPPDMELNEDVLNPVGDYDDRG